MKTFKTNSATYAIVKNDDGSLFITKNGKNSIDNAGRFIMQQGGVESLLSKCQDCECATLEEWREKKAAERKAQRDAEAEAAQVVEAAAVEAFDSLIASGEPIEASVENLRIILRAYALKGWALKLPALICGGYTINAYDCDGHKAAGMIIDNGVEIDGEVVHKVAFGAPRGHLSGYYKIR